MGALLLALAPLLAGVTQPLKDWFGYKVQVAKADQDFKLATIKAQADLAIEQNRADSTQLASRLDATTKEFKQNTFYFLLIPVIFSMLFPSKAEIMWHNFSIMPEWFQWLFLSVYSAIWGLPIAKGGYGAVTDLLASRREYKIEKIKAYNDKAFYDVLQSKVFTHGISQQQFEALEEALKARES